MNTHWLVEVLDGSGTLVAKLYVAGDTEKELVDADLFEAALRFGVRGMNWTFPRSRIECRWVDGFTSEGSLRTADNEIFLIEKSSKPNND